MTKPFLILQLRPETNVADSELEAFLKFGGLEPNEVTRIRMERDPLPKVDLANYSAVIVGGGPNNVSDPENKKPVVQRKYDKWLGELLDEIINKDFPYFGSCYGHGALALRVGGRVSKTKYGEPRLGSKEIVLTPVGKKDPITSKLPEKFKAFTGHKEAWQYLPTGVANLAQSNSCPIQIVRVKKNIYGIQFHCELDSEGLAVRANAYKYSGYFPPEDAEKIIEMAYKETVSAPMKILKEFVVRYRK